MKAIRRDIPRRRTQLQPWRSGLFGAALAVLGSCSAPPPTAIMPPAPVHFQAVATSPPVPEVLDWHDAPITPGDWTMLREGALSEAIYGLPGQVPLLVLACPRPGAVTVLRGIDAVLAPGGAAGAAAGGAATLTILTSTLTRTADAGAASRQGAPALILTLASRDPLLDAMAFSRGRFAVKATRAAALYLPAWPEVSRVIEDCRAR